MEPVTLPQGTLRPPNLCFNRVSGALAIAKKVKLKCGRLQNGWRAVGEGLKGCRMDPHKGRLRLRMTLFQSCSLPGGKGGGVVRTGPTAEQTTMTRCTLRSEGRVPVQGPRRKPMKDEMSHRGGGGVCPTALLLGPCVDPTQTQSSETGTVRGLRWHNLPRERKGG